MLQYIVFLGAGVNLGGSLYYLKETLQGHNKPNRVSFLLWGVAPLIGVSAAFADGVGLALIPVLFASLNPLMIFVASFANKKAYWKLRPFDYLCGLFSLVALVLWGITKIPETAIFFAILADAFAALPTIKKSWDQPETETSISYAGSLFSQLTVIFALETYSFSEISFPIYLALANLAILFALYRKQIKAAILKLWKKSFC